MAEKVGSIYYELDLDDKKFSRAANNAQSKAQRLGTSLKNAANKGSFILLGSLTALTTSIAAVGVSSLKTAANFETSRSALISLLGTAEQADETLTRIKKEAAETPFELPGLTDATTQLVSITRDGDKAIDILLDVGKAITASGGGQEELTRVVQNLKQIQGTGELAARDLKEIQRAVPIFDQLAEAAGTSAEEIQNAKDPAAELFRVFEEGGANMPAVANAFAIQGGNMNQLISNLKDNFVILGSELVVDIGLFDLVKDAIGRVNSILSDLQVKITEAGGTLNFLKKTVKENQEVFYAIVGAISVALIPALVSIAGIVVPIIATLAGLLAIGALLGIVIKKVVDRLGGFDATISLVKEKVDDFKSGLKSLIDTLTPILNAVKDAAIAIKDDFMAALEEAKPDLIKLKNSFIELMPVLAPVAKLIAVIAGVIIALQIAILSGLVGAITRALPNIIGMINNFVGFFTNFINLVVNLINGNWGAAWENLKGMVNNIIGFFANSFMTIINLVVGFVEGVINFFKGLYNVLVGGSIIPDLVNMILEWFDVMVKRGKAFVWNMVRDIVQKFMNLYISVREKINTLVTIVSTGFNLMKNKVFEILNTVKQTVTNKVNDIVSTISGIKDKITNALSGVKSAITEPFKNAFNELKNLVDDAVSNLDRINPFHRESPSLVDWIKMGTDEISSTYTKLFNELNSTTAKSFDNLALSFQGGLDSSGLESWVSAVSQRQPEALTSRIGNEVTRGGQGNTINVKNDFSGIVARSRSEFREIMADGVKAINEGLVAQGKKPINNIK